jgi:hypothetical protein
LLEQKNISILQTLHIAKYQANGSLKNKILKCSIIMIMKKSFLSIFLLLYVLSLPIFAQNFKANTDLVIVPTEKQTNAIFNRARPPFLVVYQKNGRILVLLAAEHGAKSLPAVQYAFNEYHPQVALIEREPNFPIGNCKTTEDGYTAALSAKNNIPLVRADADYKTQWQYAKEHGFSYEDFQMLWIIKNAEGVAKNENKQPTATEEIENYKNAVHNPAWGKLFTEKSLTEYFKQHYHGYFNSTDFIKLRLDLQSSSPKKWVKKTPFYKMMHAQPDVRSVFMLQNIAAALNEYEIVFCEMGSGHFIDIHKALKKMLGKPQYIKAEQIPPQELWQDCTLEGLQEKTSIKDNDFSF